MADRKITDLTALAAGSQATGDLLTIVDVSEAAATDKNKKITVENLLKGIPSNVGIGTSSPDEPLHISASDPAIKLEDSDGTNQYSVIKNAAGNSIYDAVNGSGTAGAHIFRAPEGSSNERMRINSSGNVGIGVSSLNSSSRLTLLESAGNAQTLEIKGANSGGVGSQPGIKFTANNGDNIGGIYGDTNADAVILQTGGTERMRIDSSGVLLVGLTSAVSIGGTPADINGTEIGRGYINISRDDTQAADHILFGKNGSIASSIGTSTTNSLTFKTGTTERMRIDSSGNVGIGSSTINQTSSNRTVLGINGSSNALLNFNHGNTLAGFMYGASDEFRMEANGTRPLIFRGNSTERMRIDSSGRVLIGVTSSFASPGGADNLQVGNNSASAESGISLGSTTASAIRFADAGNASAGMIQYVHNSGGTDYMNFYTASTERMRIDSSGNVGIGTSSPTDSNGFGRCIDIRSSTGAAIYLRDSDDTTNDTFAIGRDNTTSYLITNSGNLTFSVAGSERMRIDSSGRLLVGTTTGYGRIHADDYSMNPAGSTWLSAAYVASGAFGGGYALLDGSKGYSMYCADNGNDFFIQGHTSTTAQGSGGVKLNDRATSWTSASDERQKQNLVPITGAIDKVKTLRTVTGNYEWAPDTSHAFLIAQDVQEVLPQAVSVMNKSAATEDQRLGLAYTETIPLLTAALKEAIAEIETLKTKVAALEAG